MKPLIARWLNILLSIGAIVTAYFFRISTGTTRYILLAAIAFEVALVLVIQNKFWYCPHCHKFIGRIGLFDTTCPHCNQSLK